MNTTKKITVAAIRKTALAHGLELRGKMRGTRGSEREYLRGRMVGMWEIVEYIDGCSLPSRQPSQKMFAEIMAWEKNYVDSKRK